MNQNKKLWSDFLKKEQEDFYWVLAKKYLACFGNKSPSVNQLLELQWILSHTWVQCFIAIDSRLNQEERISLYLSAHGKTNQEIAQFCKVCSRQVERYRAAVFEKLDCKNITEAVLKGIRYLQIEPACELDEIATCSYLQV